MTPWPALCSLRRPWLPPFPGSQLSVVLLGRSRDRAGESTDTPRSTRLSPRCSAHPTCPTPPPQQACLQEGRRVRGQDVPPTCGEAHGLPELMLAAPGPGHQPRACVLHSPSAEAVVLVLTSALSCRLRQGLGFCPAVSRTAVPFWGLPAGFRSQLACLIAAEVDGDRAVAAGLAALAAFALSPQSGAGRRAVTCLGGARV